MAGIMVLFRGPSHVLEQADPEAIALSERDGTGMPVKEAFPEDHYREIQRAMDDVYHTGKPVTLPRPGGTLVVVPRLDDRGRVFGVATYFVVGVFRTADHAPQPLPELLRRAGLALAALAPLGELLPVLG